LERFHVPLTQLADIGEASLGVPPPHEEAVHGPDDRVNITNTSVYLGSSMIRLFTNAQNSRGYAGRDRCVPAGRLDRQYRSGSLATDRRKQTLKPGPDLTATRSAEIIVDDDNILLGERPRSCRQVILAMSALRVVQQRVRRRLPNMDVSAACQMVGRDPIHRRPRPVALRRRLRTPPSAVSTGPSLPLESLAEPGLVRGIAGAHEQIELSATGWPVYHRTPLSSSLKTTRIGARY
jgi:hypothetical protein